MVAIEPRPKKNPTSYRVCWYHSRTRQRFRPTYGTKTLAELAEARVNERDHDITDEELDEFLTGHKRHTEVTPAAPTFAEWAEEWLAGRLDISPRVRKEYGYVLRNRPVAAFGNVRLPNITEAMIARLRAKAASEVKPASVHYLDAVLNKCLAAAVPRWIPRNPCAPTNGGKRNLPRIRRFNACFLTVDEARLVIDNSPPEIADLVDALFNTGMRLGEAVELRCGRVSLPSVSVGPLPRDEPEPAIYIIDAKSDAGVRAITISRRLAERLRPRIEGHKPRDLVFPSPKGGIWDEHNLRQRYWLRAIAGASRCPEHMPPLRIYKRGPERLDPLSVSSCSCPTRLHKRLRIHDTRHTHVVWLLDAGWDWDVIRQRIGHEKVETTIGLYGNRQRRGNSAALEAIDPMA